MSSVINRVSISIYFFYNYAGDGVSSGLYILNLFYYFLVQNNLAKILNFLFFLKDFLHTELNCAYYPC